MTLTLALVFIVLTLGVTACLSVPLLRSRKGGQGQEKRDIIVYREQLAEVDNDVERGLLCRRQLADLELALDLHADEKEEDRHQAVVDPHQQRLVEHQRADAQRQRRAEQAIVEPARGRVLQDER